MTIPIDLKTISMFAFPLLAIICGFCGGFGITHFARNIAQNKITVYSLTIGIVFCLFAIGCTVSSFVVWGTWIGNNFK